MVETDEIVDALRQQTDVLLTIAQALVKLVELQPNTYTACAAPACRLPVEKGSTRCRGHMLPKRSDLPI